MLLKGLVGRACACHGVHMTNKTPSNTTAIPTYSVPVARAVQAERERIKQVESLLGYVFVDKSLILRALTHRSFLNEDELSRHLGHNERLEFLGDAALSLISAYTLYRSDSEATEGDLTQRRAAYVSTYALKEAALTHNLRPLMRTDKGYAALDEHSSDTSAILADAVEALIGAVFLDSRGEQGLEIVRAVVKRLLGEVPSKTAPQNKTHPKTLLQEWIQARIKKTPLYRIIDEQGTANAKVFTCQVLFVFDDKERVLAVGTGPSKAAAGENAAAKALALLQNIENDLGKKNMNEANLKRILDHSVSIDVNATIKPSKPS